MTAVNTTRFVDACVAGAAGASISAARIAMRTEALSLATSSQPEMRSHVSKRRFTRGVSRVRV